MSKTVASTFTAPVLGELQPGKPVRASTWQDIIAAQHYVFARQGGLILNAVFDPEWTSLDYGSGGSSYHSQSNTGSAGMIELDRVQGCFRFDRHEYNTGNAAQGWSLQMDTYARNLTIRATCVRFDTEDGNSGSTTSFTGLASAAHDASNSEWLRSTLEFTPAQASRSGTFSDLDSLAIFAVYVEAVVPSSGTGYLHQVGIRVAPLTTGTEIPRGAIS